MAPRDGSQERTSTPDTVEKGMATINTLRYTKTPSRDGVDGILILHVVFSSVADIVVFFRIGVKAFVEKVGRLSLLPHRSF